MSKAGWIRLTIFVLCLGIYLWHIGSHLLYSTGLRNQTDINATIATHLNKEYHYSIQHPLLQQQKAELYYKVYPEDTFFVIQQRLVARNLPINIELISFYAKFVPQNDYVDKIISIIKNNQSTSIAGNLEFTYDDRCRLIGINSNYEVLGIACGVDAFVDHTGLHANINVADLGVSEPYKDPTFDPDNVHGINLMLPPNLKTGQLITLRVLSNEVQVEVGAQQEITIGNQAQKLFQGGLIYNDSTYAHLWFDKQGIIYKVKVLKRPIEITLNKITNPDGETIWKP